MEDDRITRIARALCRSARIDPDSLLAYDHRGPDAFPEPKKPQPDDRPMPAWTQFRGAALTFVHAHDDRVVAPL